VFNLIFRFHIEVIEQPVTLCIHLYSVLWALTRWI